MGFWVWLFTKILIVMLCGAIVSIGDAISIWWRNQNQGRWLFFFFLLWLIVSVAGTYYVLLLDGAFS